MGLKELNRQHVRHIERLTKRLGKAEHTVAVLASKLLEAKRLAEAKLAEAQDKLVKVTGEKVIAQHGRALELMSRGSATVELENKLREQIALAELRAEAAEAKAAEAEAENKRLQVARIGDSEIIGMWMSKHEALTTALSALEPPAHTVARKRRTSRRLRMAGTPTK